MTDKKKLHHFLRLLRKVHYFWLLGLCIFFAVTAVLALRANNQRMIGLRNAVFAADKNNGNVEAALKTMREYVFKHMNTNLASGNNAIRPPIQLKYLYDRLAAANQAAYEASTAKVLADAAAICTAEVPGPAVSLARFACAKAYGDSHPVILKTVTDDFYKFDFVSPVWSPDLAGWSIVFAVLFLLLFVIWFVSEFIIRLELNSHR